MTTSDNEGSPNKANHGLNIPREDALKINKNPVGHDQAIPQDTLRINKISSDPNKEKLKTVQTDPSAPNSSKESLPEDKPKITTTPLANKVEESNLFEEPKASTEELSQKKNIIAIAAAIAFLLVVASAYFLLSSEDTEVETTKKSTPATEVSVEKLASDSDDVIETTPENKKFVELKNLLQVLQIDTEEHSQPSSEFFSQASKALKEKSGEINDNISQTNFEQKNLASIHKEGYFEKVDPKLKIYTGSKNKLFITDKTYLGQLTSHGYFVKKNLIDNTFLFYEVEDEKTSIRIPSSYRTPKRIKAYRLRERNVPFREISGQTLAKIKNSTEQKERNLERLNKIAEKLTEEKALLVKIASATELLVQVEQEFKASNTAKPMSEKQELKQ